MDKKRTLQFFVPLKKIPTVTHQQKRVSIKNGKPVFYETEQLQKARALFIAHLAQHVPSEKFKGAIFMLSKWCYPRTKDKQHGEYKTTKPDTDNMIKLFKDCMTTCGFWIDDAQVCSEHIEKFYSDVVGIYVEIKEL